MISKEKTRVTVTLSKENAAALYALAALYRMSVSELVEMLVEKLEDVTGQDAVEGK